MKSLFYGLLVVLLAQSVSAAGTAMGADSRTLAGSVPLNASVVIPAGQTKTFTISLSGGEPNSNAIWNRIVLSGSVNPDVAVIPVVENKPFTGGMNVVMIMVDDLGWRDLACYGSGGLFG